MNMTAKFNKRILDMIDRFSYNMHLVKRNKNIKCTCVAHESDQARPDCPKCLGTGNKITIKKFKGASQDTQLPPTFRSDNFVVARNFYMPINIDLSEDDFIVDKDNPYMAIEIQELIGLEGTIPYKKASCVKKKFDATVFMKNFNAIINSKKVGASND